VSGVEYARADDGTHVAYRVLAAASESGPERERDIVMQSGGLIPMEVFEDEPGFARLLEGLRSLGRVVVYDRRGIGLSDPIVDWERPILDQWADDLSLVVEASGARNAAVFAWDGYGIATRFAARHPDQLGLLVLFQPLAVPDERWDDWAAGWLALTHSVVAGQQEDFLARLVPSGASDVSFRDWYTRAGRVGASPTTARRIWGSVFTSQPGEQLLEQVRTPTLVLCRRDAIDTPVEAANLTAARLGGASVVELDGADTWPFVGDVDAVVAEVADFVVGERRLPPPQRVLAAVMFTDLVASTQRAASLGDAHWKSMLDRHDASVRTAVGGCGGTVVKTTGDGVLAVLPSAAAAVRAATRVRDALAADGLEVRIGIHVGDIDRRAEDVSGLAVVVAARTMAVAGAGQIVVTASVYAAIAGQTATFETLGPHELKGVPARWDLYRLVDTTNEGA
jgi:class 3 adenylate cyclase